MVRTPPRSTLTVNPCPSATLFRSDGAYGIYESGDRKFLDGKHPYWSWAHVHAFDIQTGRMTRLEQVKSITGGHATAVNDPGIYDRYLTNAALMHLGNG